MEKGQYKKNIQIWLSYMFLFFSIIVCFAATISGCSNQGTNGKKGSPQENQGERKKEVPITLNVYNELSSFSGVQKGWMADVLEKKLHVKINIIPCGEDYSKQYKESGDIGDIAIWTNNHFEYAEAVKNNLLYDWNQNGLLEKHGPYIKENMQISLEKNRKMTADMTNGQSDTLYGFLGGMMASQKDHSDFFNTWDIRWDIYKKLGYPAVKNLEDFEKLVKDMVKKCPTNDSGDKTYSISLWSDWDESMVTHVAATASAFYGYDKLGIGLYDTESGKFHDALEKNGPYLEMLRFYNHLYQEGLLDPDSRNQSFENAIEKVKKGSTMFSIYNYAGSMVYNTSRHLQEGKLMQSLKPEQASPLVYGKRMPEGENIWSIGAKTKYPEKCMEVLNWLCTPEGCLTTLYGPKDLCWRYNSDRKTELTELGKECMEDSSTQLGGEYEGSFMDGISQIGLTWSQYASNPETEGETYNSSTWESNFSDSKTEMEKDWCEKTGAWGVYDYLEKGKYTISPTWLDYGESRKSSALTEVWDRVSQELINASWRAIYAESDRQYHRIVNGMIKKCREYGYNKCVKWSVDEAARRKNIEDAENK